MLNYVCFMKKVKVRSKKLNLPWINERLWTLMKQRDVALKMALKTKTEYDKRVFTTLRNKVIKDLRNAKASFFINAIAEAKGNAKHIWQN